MSRNKRFTLWVVALVVLGAGALAVLYFPLRRVAEQASSGPGGAEGAPLGAWPDAAELDHFLAVREAAFPPYDEQRSMIEQSFIPGSAESIVKPFGAALAIRGVMDARAAALTNHDMTLERYHELTDLVYLRWLRADRGRPYPEARVAGEIAEFAEILEMEPEASLTERQMARYERRRQNVFARSAFLEELMAMDPEETLAAIPAEARSTLEAQRERIASVRMGVLDAMEVHGARKAQTSREDGGETPSG